MYMTDIQSWKDFKHQYETEKRYTQKEMDEALAEQAKSLTVNRVVMSYTGRYGPDDCRALQILAVRTRPEGVLVIVSG